MQVSSKQTETCLSITRAVCTVSKRSHSFASSEPHKSIAGMLFTLQSSTMFTWITSKCLWFPVSFQAVYHLSSRCYRWQELLGAFLRDVGRGQVHEVFMLGDFPVAETHSVLQSRPSCELWQIDSPASLSDGINVLFLPSLAINSWLGWSKLSGGKVTGCCRLVVLLLQSLTGAQVSRVTWFSALAQ